MEAYTGFAEVYDLFMEDIPYEKWGEFLLEQLANEGILDGLVLDLGCGTGRLTRFLARHQFEMIGLDSSLEMLGIAKEKEEEENLDIFYSCQDMREFELYGTVRAIVCCCDCLNYILEEEELLQVFRLVNNYLDPGGIFFFDLNTPYKYEQMGEMTFAENRDSGSFIWENYYDREEQVNEYDLTLFIKKEQGLYEKYEEIHVQKAYPLQTIKRLLELSGLEFITVYDGYKNQMPDEQSDRICILARERGKEKEDK